MKVIILEIDFGSLIKGLFFINDVRCFNERDFLFFLVYKCKVRIINEFEYGFYVYDYLWIF